MRFTPLMILCLFISACSKPVDALFDAVAPPASEANVVQPAPPPPVYAPPLPIPEIEASQEAAVQESRAAQTAAPVQSCPTGNCPSTTYQHQYTPRRGIFGWRR